MEYFFQVALAGIVSGTVVSGGMSVGFPAVALPAMLQPNSSLPINNEEASWIGKTHSSNCYTPFQKDFNKNLMVLQPAYRS